MSNRLWIPELFLFVFGLFLLISVKLELWNKWALYAIFVLVVGAEAILFLIHFFIWQRSIGIAPSKSSTSGLAKHMAKINDLLSGLPNGDTIQWGRGDSLRVRKRLFVDDTGSKKSYLAVLGRQSVRKKLVLVVYSIEDEDIVDWTGDPTPQQVMDPFYRFDPYKRTSQHESNSYYRRNRTTDPYGNGMNINIGGERVPQDDFYKPTRGAVNKAMSTLEDIDKKGRNNYERK